MRRTFSFAAHIVLLTVAVWVLSTVTPLAQIPSDVQAALDALATRITALEKIVLPGGGEPSDTTAPTVAMAAPPDAAIVSGTSREVRADASDNVGIVGVQFRLNGSNLMGEELLAPYEIFWNTTLSANGAYTLTAVARDAAGNTTTSASRAVTVANDPPPPPPDAIDPTVALTAPADAAIVSGVAVAVTASASDDVGVAGVQFRLDGSNLMSEDVVSPYSILWNTTLVPDGIYTLTAVARDAAGNTRTSTSRSARVTNAVPPTPSDSTAPTVSLTAPASGATVSGATVSVTATASDNVGVVGVRFKVGAANLGAEDTSTPYAVTWDTLGLTNGSFSLTAVARDAAGNTTTSTARTVTVSNVAPPPPPPPSTGNTYFDTLAALPGRTAAYTLRSQADIDRYPTGANQWNKLPVVYDAAMNAALFMIDTTGATPHSGSTDTQQKWMPIPTPSASSTFITWDFRMDNGWDFAAGHIANYKTWRFDTTTNTIWLTARTEFVNATGAGEGVAELYITTPSTQWLVSGGATQGNNESLQPRAAQFFIQPNTWTRIWWFLEGVMGGTVNVSIWAADANRNAVQLFNRVAIRAPSGFQRLRLENDTSQDTANNGVAKMWQKNLVVVQGLSYANVLTRLQRP